MDLLSIAAFNLGVVQCLWAVHLCWCLISPRPRRVVVAANCALRNTNISLRIVFSLQSNSLLVQEKEMHYSRKQFSVCVSVII